MEEAMKVHALDAPGSGDALRTFSQEDPIGLSQVENELSALWRQASEALQAGQAPEEGAGLARACEWNLVNYQAHPKSHPGHAEGEPERMEVLLTRVTVSVPARVLHLEHWDPAMATAPGKEVETWVSNTCLVRASGPSVVCCEEVHLAGYGDKGLSHFPALVRALLNPDLPVALLWLDDVPRKGRMLGQLLQLSDRMVIDTQLTEHADSLVAVRELRRSTRVRLVDLGWMRLIPLRHLVAEFFDEPERVSQLEQMESITIETSPNGRNTGLLVLGWLLSRCGYTDVSAVDLGEQQSEYRWSVKHNDRSFPLTLRIREGNGGLDGIFSLEIRAGGDAFSLRDADPEHMSVVGPDRNLPNVPLREWDDVGLLVEALGGHSADKVYGEALEMAATLADSEQWIQ
jgi:hypothetical protein